MLVAIKRAVHLQPSSASHVMMLLNVLGQCLGAKTLVHEEEDITDAGIPWRCHCTFEIWDEKTPRNQAANDAPDVLVPCEATQAHTQSGGGFARRWRPEEAWIMRGGGLLGEGGGRQPRAAPWESCLGKGGAEPVRHRAALRQAANQALPARLPSQSGTPLPACNYLRDNLPSPLVCFEQH